MQIEAGVVVLIEPHTSQAKAQYSEMSPPSLCFESHLPRLAQRLHLLFLSIFTQLSPVVPVVAAVVVVAVEVPEVAAVVVVAVVVAAVDVVLSPHHPS